MRLFVKTRHVHGFQWLPPLVLGLPHASRDVPPDCGLAIPEWKLRSHEGYDPGSLEMASVLCAGSGAEANMAIGNVSRLVAELNRTVDYACSDIPQEKLPMVRQRYYWPYVKTLYLITGRLVTRRQFPVFIDVHTCTDHIRDARRRARMDGEGRKFFRAEPEKRRPFGVEGDKDSVLMRVLWQSLRDEFQAAGRRGGGLRRIPFLRSRDFEDPVGFNEPYDLSVGSPFREKVQGPQYAKGFGFPSLTFETRNRLAKYPAVQKVALCAVRKTLRNPRVNNEIRRLKIAHRQKLAFS